MTEIFDHQITKHVLWTLILDGLWFLVFGILVLVYPATLFIFVAVTSFWIGFTLLLLAWRLKSFMK